MNVLRFQRVGLLTATAILTAGLTACAAPRQHYADSGYQQGGSYQQGAYAAPARGTEYGRVVNVYALQEQRSGQTSGAGAVLGAVVGGVLGHQIGGGSGRTVATGVGVIGGALAGNAIEARNNNAGPSGYRIVISLDQGGQRDYDVSSPGDLRVGDRVRVDNGQISRY